MCAWLGGLALLLGLWFAWLQDAPLPVRAAQTPDLPPPPPANAWTLGAKRLLVIRVAFPDAPAPPASEADTLAMLEDVCEFYLANSYRQFSLEPVLTPVFTLPRTVQDYGNDPGQRHTLRTDAIAAALAAGFPEEAYDLDLVVNGQLFGYKGQVGGRGCWAQGLDSDAIIHELGHNLGLSHANLWIGRGDTVIGPGRMLGYGNRFDTMSLALPGTWPRRHFNAAHKSRLGWLPPEHVHSVQSSGTYRLYAFDAASLESGNHYALVLTRSDGRQYWIERRSLFTNNPSADNGALIYFGAWPESYGACPLLDMTPNSHWEDDSSDAALVLGRTFSDPEHGIHVTTLARSSMGPDWIDLRVEIGSFPSNRPPVLSLEGPTEPITPGSQIALRAVTQDPDGDPLSVSWDFGDGTLGDDRKTIQKTWPAPGDYMVRCVVTDRRGGTSCASLAVLVGQPGTLRVSGRITFQGSAVAGARVSLGPDRVTYTDADGRYTATGLAPGTYQLHPGLAWNAFSPLSRTITLTDSNVAGLDFDATWTDTPNNPPYVVTQSPSPSSLFGMPATVPLQAWVHDDGLVRRVEFTSPDGLGVYGMGNGVVAVWSNVWTDVPQGNHMIRVQAFDDDGAVGTGLPAFISVMDTAVRLDSLARDSEGVVTLVTTAPQGAVLALEASPDLAAWQTLEQRTNETSVASWQDAAAVGRQRRFYRVRVESGP